VNAEVVSQTICYCAYAQVGPIFLSIGLSWNRWYKWSRWDPSMTLLTNHP